MKESGKEKKQIRQMLLKITAVLFLLSAVIVKYPISAQTSTTLYNLNPIDEKLSGTIVNCMLQDSSGFLWFGSQIGLFRYDGYTLKPYSFNSGASNRFVSNFITAVCEEDSGIIWIGTFGSGMFKFDPKTGDYLNFNSNDTSKEGLSDNIIRTLCKDDSGRLWIGTQNKGLDCLDPASGKFTHYENIAGNVNSISSNTITSICKDRAGALWIGTTGGGLNKFDIKTGRFLHFTKTNGEPDSIHNNISTLYIDKANIMWIVTAEGSLIRFDTVYGRPVDSEFKELDGFKISTVCQDISGTLWVGTYGKGVRMLDPESGKFTVHGCEFSQNTPSCDYRVMSLYADSSGNLWIGTEGSGVGRINTNLSFISYKGDMYSDTRFGDDVVLSIYKDKSGVVWIGTANGGVNRFDRENNLLMNYRNDLNDDNCISSNSVSSIFEDSQGMFLDILVSEPDKKNSLTVF